MKPHRVLVVDDDVELVGLLARSLRSEGYEVETALDGFTALVIFPTALPDLVVLDLLSRGWMALPFWNRSDEVPTCPSSCSAQNTPPMLKYVR